MKKYAIFFMFCLPFSALCQDEDKVVLLQSLLEDGFYINSFKDIEDYQDYISNLYDAIEINASSEIAGEWTESYSSYSLQLFNIRYLDYEWNILRFQYQDKRVGWYRVTGYKESDFIHFYNRVLLRFTSNRKEATGMLTTWSKRDTVFSAIDFDCLIRAVKHRRKNCNCVCLNSSTLEFIGDRIVVTGPNEFRESYLKEQGIIIPNRWSTRLFKGVYP